tara:strand:- start:262 stop:480 length:219 start_codon:yes stop_codon:yes gene_type:complete
MLGGIVVTGTVLLVLAIVILVMAAFWYYLKFLKADDLADTVEKSGGKIVDIFGKILFYSIAVLILIVIANIL